jgi:hypothetical protein
VIRGYQQVRFLPPARGGQFQWLAALKAGLAVGLVFMLVARGNPWAGLTFSSPVVMGRLLPPAAGIPLAVAWLIHLLVSVAYGLVVSLVVAHLSRWRAILIGAAVGLLLYFLNRLMVHFLFPGIEGSEAGVLFTHLVFGMICAGAYRGLLRREPVASDV